MDKKNFSPEGSGDIPETREQKTTRAKITIWNAQKNFGFVNLPQGRAFVHGSNIRPSLPLQLDLNGRDLEIIKVEQSNKGLNVAYAKLIPLSYDWEVSVNSIYQHAVYFPNASSQFLKSFKAVSEPYERPPGIDEAQINAAKAAGCPEAVIAQMRKDYEEKFSEWEKKEADKADKAAAVKEARRLIKTLSDDQSVVIYQLKRPEPTTLLDEECIEKFNRAWQGFMEKVKKTGQNTSYGWAVIPMAEIPNLRIQAEYSYSTMAYGFS